MHFKWMTAAALLSAAPVFSAVPFRCGGVIPLQAAIDLALPNETLLLTGTCSGPVAINRKNIALQSNSGAVIDGAGKDAITVSGPVRVSLNGIVVQHGNNGINAMTGAQLVLTNTQVLANKAIGILLTGASSATLSGAVTNVNRMPLPSRARSKRIPATSVMIESAWYKLAVSCPVGRLQLCG